MLIDEFLKCIMGVNIMKLKMFIIMGTIVLVGLIFTICGLLLSAGRASRHERRLIKKIQETEDEESTLRLVK